MDKEVLKSYRKAGEILQECLKYGEKLIKPGTPVLEILNSVENKILREGGKFAFPAQISINATAAHDCAAPNDERLCKEGDVVKLDAGVHIDGYIADSAVTVNLGDYDELVKASKDALAAATKVVDIGVKTSEIGKAIQETIESYNFAPVRNLSGHGLSKFTVHDKPSIPNFDTGGDTTLKDGQVIAIEPFASTGAGIIYESSGNTLFSMVREKPIRNVMARKLLKDIKTFNDLPFTTRWLTQKHPEGVVRLGLNELVREGILIEHPPLVDKEQGIISQAEHTIVLDKKPIIITKP